MAKLALLHVSLWVWLSLASMLPWCLAFVVCPESKLAFFHVPKAGGTSVTFYLARREDATTRNYPWDCKVSGWGSSKLYKEVDRTQVIFDAAHVTPSELERYIFHGIGDLRDWYRTMDVSPQTLIQEWNTFTVVRNPYLRVLGAFEQRTNGEYDWQWGTDFPRNSFVEFMRWLEQGLKNKKLSWCCSPTITHFRPSTMYTHWDNDLPAVATILKLENIDETLPAFMGRFYDTSHIDVTLHPKNQYTNSKKREALCNRPEGCLPNADLGKLLETRHTNETIRIVNRLYKRDFELLRYNMLLDEFNVRHQQSDVAGYNMTLRDEKKNGVDANSSKGSQDTKDDKVSLGTSGNTILPKTIDSNSSKGSQGPKNDTVLLVTSSKAILPETIDTNSSNGSQDAKDDRISLVPNGKTILPETAPNMGFSIELTSVVSVMCFLSGWFFARHKGRLRHSHFS